MLMRTPREHDDRPLADQISSRTLRLAANIVLAICILLIIAGVFALRFVKIPM